MLQDSESQVRYPATEALAPAFVPDGQPNEMLQ